jgi:hypothetical protein
LLLSYGSAHHASEDKEKQIVSQHNDLRQL